MAVKARVNIETARRNYKPGEVIAERLSDADLEFLRKRGFLTEEFESGEDGPGDDYAGSPDGISWAGSQGEDMEDSAEYKDEAALKRMSKEEIVEYAESVGLAIESEMLKNDMIEAVLNHTEQLAAEMG